MAEWEEMISRAVKEHTSKGDGMEVRTNKERDGCHTFWRALVGNEIFFQDEMITCDWYHDFQALGRRCREAVMNEVAGEVRHSRLIFGTNTFTDDG